MSISEITEEKDEEAPPFVDKEAQKERIRRLLECQKSFYYSSSSSSSSSAASCSSSSSNQKSSSLLDLMKGGSTSLRRLFDMEHPSLAIYFKDYSGSPILKPIPLWGCDSDYEIPNDSWASLKQLGAIHDSGPDIGQTKFASESSFMDGEFGFGNRKVKFSNRKLRRKRSFNRFRLKLRRLRILICGRKF